MRLAVAPCHRPPGRTTRAFRPTAAQRAYLEAWLDPRQPKTISGVARHIGIDRKNIHNWLAREEFRAWFDGEVSKATELSWRPALLKCSQLAMQGSAEHLRLLAQIRGALDVGRDSGDTRRSDNVLINVPRPTC